MITKGLAPSSWSGRTRIKICGITSVDVARIAVRSGADAIGIVFAADSPRRVLPGAAIRIARELPPFVTAVGVFRDPSDAELQNWRGTWVQIHGREDAPQLARVAQQRSIIRGFEFDRGALWRFNENTNIAAMLVDGSAGGEGKPFDHDALAASMQDLSKPVVLAGGLSPDNVGEAIRTVMPFAVDVSSGVESSEGVKDGALIRAFCDAVREADAEIRES